MYWKGFLLDFFFLFTVMKFKGMRDAKIMSIFMKSLGLQMYLSKL